MRDKRLADVWLDWLGKLGGSWNPPETEPLSEKRTGRRDPDKHPRLYGLNPERYRVDEHGSIRRKAQ